MCILSISNVCLQYLQCEKREQKTKAWKEREAAKAKKKKEGEEKLRKKGRDANKKSTKDIGMVKEGRSRIKEDTHGRKNWSGVRQAVTRNE